MKQMLTAKLKLHIPSLSSSSLVSCMICVGMVLLLLARAIDDSEESERILRVNREFYTQVFSG